MESIEKKPLTSVSMYNFQRMKIAVFDVPETGLLVVRGKNAVGKSSTLNFVRALTEGAKAGGDKPLHEGEKLGGGHGIFGDLRVEVKYKEKGDKVRRELKVSYVDGSSLDEAGQTALDKLVSGFPDPTELLALKDIELTRKALGIVGSGEALAEAEKIISGAVQGRKELKLQLKAVAGLAGKASDVDLEAVPQAELDALFERWSTVNGNHKEHDEAKRDEERQAAHVLELQGELKHQQDKLTAIRERLGRASAAVTTGPALAACQEELDNAKAHNAKVEAMGPILAAKAKAKDLEEKVARAEESVVNARAYRQSMLEEIVWPSPGLGYDPETERLTLNGRPFTVASTAERLIAAADMVMASGAIIPLILIRHGNDLDDEHLALLDAHIDAKGWQGMIERVDSDPDGPGIYIENGEIVTA